MITRYTLSIGLNDKDTKAQRIDTIEAYKIIENILTNNNIQGATIFQTRGLYQGQWENGLQVVINNYSNDNINNNILSSIRDLKISLNQNEIELSETKIKTRLV